jgi:hypothetical protein
VQSVITVRLGTPRGFDDEAALLEGLENATGLSWNRTAGTERALSGIGDIIVSAVVTQAAGMAFHELRRKVDDVAKRVRERHLNPPPVTVEESQEPADAEQGQEPADTADPAADPAADLAAGQES